MYSTKVSVQLLGEMLYAFGINDIIISPGSRNAPLTIHFTQDTRYKCYSIVDERSAAFFALGMAQSKKKPIVICCTSGTASANYYPAIIEAYYQNIPLLILTADRPENFVDIFDGQTIRQKNIYHNHIYGSYQLSEGNDDQSISDNFLMIKEAITQLYNCSGPIHINIPFSEPLYELTDTLSINIEKLTLPKLASDNYNWNHLLNKWNSYEKKMILVGMQQPSPELNSLLESLARREDTIVLTETTSNLKSDLFYSNIDRYISSLTDKNIYEEFNPDLLLTIGQNIVSKKIKVFLRNSNLKEHWHLDKHWHPDTYFCLTEKIKTNPINFLEKLDSLPSKESLYSTLWLNHKKNKNLKHDEFLKNSSYSDLKVMEVLDAKIPNFYNLQVSNSSAIRYAQLFNFNAKNKVFCNRGASGIDGSSSTAIGFASVELNPTVLITGDIGFFYDINALWNKYIPNTFRIILMNNGGGDIFNIISGPDQISTALNEFFVTKHNRNAKLISEEFNLIYKEISCIDELENHLPIFFSSSNQPKILEINTKNTSNAKILRDYFSFLENN
ncbi:2-succinyl-5-enolpyruvyl-6-hydroxy-3-cyclohexene-1-carboxylic-acid synthase [Apibacter muscae]|uniref:2-succinyl-5-enolpyruvyl-6-hydroxy-3- cyclohexene-1-carboxylic-acid synthase n=1 Tax=Apibacter muscae TaxID=2509004 RepID=UPI0011AC7973|nr:2-succinyl-5-enolpyruvyl-6-hydroxy-3-cyclohexene-1-carboxylic-acid synthase [Apibacter muscae]TWP29618.1 2-succinyl-5-enolpyruvyl-6-hydroxy-3-cyclohexene-1-carboxylic-acid synthase [Apibacter muscae]